MDAHSRAAGIKLIAFDIDGVMTDGGLHYTDDGHELKSFNVHDGLGIKLLQQQGCPIAKKHAHFVTEAGGGHGAVREAIEFILSAQGKLAVAFAPYLEQA